MTAMCPEGFVGREYHEDRVAELEREIQERANKALVDAAHKAQLIYWLLCVVTENKREWGDAALCLTGLGYAPDSTRARNMLERGEPGPRKLDETEETEEPESPLPLYMQAAVADLVEDIVAGVAHRRDNPGKLHEALVTIATSRCPCVISGVAQNVRNQPTYSG